MYFSVIINFDESPCACFHSFDINIPIQKENMIERYVMVAGSIPEAAPYHYSGS